MAKTPLTVVGAEKLRAKLPFVDVFSPPSDPGPLISHLTQGEIRSMEESVRRKVRLAAVGRVAAGLAHAEVVDRGVIEGGVVADHPRGVAGAEERMGAVGQPAQVGQRGRVVGAVVDHEDLERRIGGLFQDAVDAALEELQAVARGDDERDGGRRRRVQGQAARNRSRGQPALHRHRRGVHALAGTPRFRHVRPALVARRELRRAREGGCHGYGRAAQPSADPATAAAPTP